MPPKNEKMRFFKKFTNSATSLPLSGLIYLALLEHRQDGSTERIFGSEAGAFVFYFYVFCFLDVIKSYGLDAAINFIAGDKDNNNQNNRRQNNDEDDNQNNGSSPAMSV